MPQVIASLYHQHGETLTVKSEVVNARSQQRASVAVSSVHPSPVVDQQCRDLTATMYGDVQLERRDARCVDVVDAGSVGNQQ